MSLKVRLLLGAAAPLVFALPAFAQTSISTATTAPVQTTTANNVTVTSTGSITLDKQAGATAVTVNSNNTLDNDGGIAVTDSNSATGVRLLPGFTGAYSGVGSVSVVEDYTRTDADNDGDLDGPIATGTGRSGILLDPGGTFTGNILIERSTTAAGSVIVEGNNSFGVSLRSNLAGNYIQDGTVSLSGANGVGLDIRENVTGNIDIGGSTSVNGEGSVAVRVLGDVGGEFLIDGTVSASGFISTSLSNYEDPDLADDNDTGLDEPAKLDADDLLVGGSAVEIRGDLARGLLVNGAAVGGTDPTDDVKDVVQDYNENRSAGSVSSIGSAPALLVQSLDGAAGDAIVLGRVRETILDSLDDDKDSNLTEVIGVFNYDYGFMNRGSIQSTGLNTGFASTGLRIAGSNDGQHQTTIEGGIFNGGQISARAFEANAVAVDIGAGVSTPLLLNSGSIAGVVNTETGHDAYGVRIGAGANIGTVTNSGLIQTQTRGYDGDSIAFQDLSGTVTTFTNNSRIGAFYIDDDTTDTIISGLGRAIGVDLSRSGSNITLRQTDTIDNARIYGDVLFGVGNDRFELLSGELNGNVSFGAGADTFQINSAKVFGSATFGGASAAFSMNAAEMTGGIALGAASGTLGFTGGSIYNGAITRSGAAALAMNIDNSTVNNFGAGTLGLTSLSAANNAKIGLVVNNARVTGNIPIYNVSGTATIAANTVFTPIFDQFTNQSFTLRVLNAGSLNLGGPLSAMLNANGPYLYNVSLVQPNANAIDLVLGVKTATQLGLNGREAGAYNAVLDLLQEDDTVAAALTSINTASGFGRSWADIMPSPDAAVVRLLATNASAAFGATAQRLDLISDKPDAPGGAWVEEFGVFHRSDATARNTEVTGGGFGVAAGIDVLSTGTALIGAFAALESAEIEEEVRTAAPLNVSQTSIGLYGGWLNGNLAVNGAASVGLVDFTSDRTIEIGSLKDRARANWSGQSYSAAARATYTLPLGWIDAKPFISADYVGFNQDGYSETVSTNSSLGIEAGDSDASLATASYGVALVGNFGGDEAFSWRPELSVGYRNVLSWNSSPAAMRFNGGSAGTSFTLDPGIEPEDAIIAGLGLNVGSQFLNIKLGYDAELAENAMTHYGSVTLRMAFW